MNKNRKNTLISEMKIMLNTNNKPKRKGLFEGLGINEPEMEPEMEQIPSEEEKMDQIKQQDTNPLDEDPEISKLITSIRVQTLTGLQKLAEHPESSQYELLKKIFLLIDKAVEDKIEEE